MRTFAQSISNNHLADCRRRQMRRVVMCAFKFFYDFLSLHSKVNVVENVKQVIIRLENFSLLTYFTFMAFCMAIFVFFVFSTVMPMSHGLQFAYWYIYIYVLVYGRWDEQEWFTGAIESSSLRTTHTFRG